MKKSLQFLLNLFVLILMILNPLSSFASTAVHAQTISDAKSAATVDITAGKIWDGGPEEKPELWFMLMREGAGGLEEVPGILPKPITATQRIVSWFGLPKYNAAGAEIIYKVREGIWDPIEEKFEQGIPEGYRAVYSLDELTIRNIFIEDEIQPPVETPPPAFEPVIKETETPVTTPEPTEEPADPVEEPTDPTEEPTDPVEEPTDPTEEPADPTEPIDLPVITPEPDDPPFEEPRFTTPVTATINWQGGELPRPVFWLKLQKIDSFGNVADVPGTAIIQANLATRVTWANIADYGQLSDYTVAVVDSAGNPYTLPGYTTTIDGLKVTFTYEEQNTIDVIANVEWLASLEPKEIIDFEQYPDYKIPSVYLRLYRQANENEIPVALLSTELIQLANAASTASWLGLPAGSTHGTQYIYSVKQVDADGKDFIPEGFEKIEDGLLVQNILIPGGGGMEPHDLKPPVPTHTYIFNNGATVFATQYVRNGETLLDPGNPGGDGFTGWYDINDNLQTLPRANVAVTENQTIHYYAHFDDFVYVRFYDTQVAPVMVIKTKQIPNGAVTDGTGVPLIPGPGKALDYWSTTIGGGTPFDFTQPITSDTDLYAVLKDAWKVTFASRGGSSVLPQYVSAGDTATPPTAPSRMGYTFYRWTTDEAGTNPYDFSTPVTADLTLYAQWTPANASYVVVYWQENAEDDGYTFFEIEEKTGPSGSPASYTPKSYTGFHFDHRDEKTIAGDGSTVENVYYKRNVWTLTIEYRTGSSWNYTWHTFSTTPFKYGQSTAPAYNAAVAAYPYYGWFISRTSTISYSEAPAMPNQNLTISGKYTGNVAWTIKYHEFGTSTPIKEDYVFYGSTGSTYHFTEEDGIDIPGFTVTPIDQWEPLQSGTPARTGIIYYTRNNYDITFHHNNPGSGPGTWLTRPYQSNISTAPTHSGLTAGTTKVLNGVTYTFTGNWFENPACQGTAYNFTGATMPAHNLVFYAEWTPETYSFTAYDPEGNVVPGTPINVLPGGTVDPASLPTGFTWYWYVGGFFVPYDFARPIYEDVEVYAIRTVALTYQVSYDANGGSGAPVDSNHYESGVQAVVLDAPSVAPAATPAFLGWSLNSDGSGPRYQPHDKITVNGNITLYAIWGPVPQKTKVTYKPGVGGTGADQTFENLIINGTITLIDNPFTPIEDYTFVGWKNATDGQIYQPGDVLQVDANAEGTNNILTAQWTRRIVAQKIWSGGSDPRPDVWFRLYRKVGTTGIGEPVPGLSPNPVQLPQPTGTSASVEWTGLLATNSSDEPYIYYVEEVDADGNPATTPGYRMTIGEDGLTITNTFLGSPDPTNITSLRFEKTWMPNPLPAGVTPPPITVKVWGNGALYRTATLTYPDTVVEWKNLPLYDENGTPITYTITEEPIPDFAEGSPVYTESAMESVYCTQEQNQSAWPLQNPSFVIIRTTGNGPFVIWTLNHLDPADRNAFKANAIAAGPNEQPLKALSTWTGDIIWLEGSNVSYDVLPNDPASGLITINAVFNPDGTTYTTTLNFQGTNTWNSFAVGTYSSKLAKITNTYIAANKIWVNGKAPRPTVWFKLYRQIGTGTPEPVPGASIKELPSGTTKVTWDGETIATTNAAGEPYIFSVREVDAAGNDFTPPNYTKSENGMTVTNTYQIPGDGTATATKRWSGGPAPRPTVWFKLYRNIEGGTVEEVPGAAILPLPNGTTSVTWTGLAKTDINGNVYTFSVKEVDEYGNDFTPPNYTKSGEGTLEITNTYVPPTNGTAEATKEWVGGPTPRPTVWFKLYRKIAGGDLEEVPETEAPIKALVDGVLSVTWNNLTETDNNGNPYTFSVKEGLMVGDPAVWQEGQPANYTKVENGLNVTNTYVSPIISVPSYKDWDPSTLANKFPVTFQLWRYYEGEASSTAVMVQPAMTVVLDGIADSPCTGVCGYENDAWQVLWLGIPATDSAGRTYKYVVKEILPSPLPAGFTQSGELMDTITNSYQSPTDNLTATKVWEPAGLTEDLKVPVTFQLYRSCEDPNALYPVEPIEPAVTVSAPDWNHTWDDMPKTNPNGYPYTYWVKEVGETDGTIVLDGNTFAVIYDQENLKVTNTYVSPTAGQTGTKEWAPPDLLDEYKVTVWFQLWRYIGSDPAAAVKVGDPVAITAPWTYTWADMPTHDANGNAYTYYVTEVDADGNDWTPVNFEKEEDGMKVTNTYVSPTAGQTGTKEWAPPDLLDEYKVTVWFQLWRYIGSDPAAAVKVGDPVAITAPWTYTWAGMPTHDANGNAYSYYVTEVDADGNDWTPVNFEKEEDGMTVTNTYVSPTAGQTGTKEWAPPDLLDEYKVTVWFQLWRYIGSDSAAAVKVGDPVAITAPWTYTWADMPTHDANGNAYTYYVTEVDADGNDWTPVNFEKEEAGMKVTNTYVSPTEGQTGTKEWAPPDLLDEYKVTVWFQLWRYIGSDSAAAVKVGDPVAITAPWTYTWADMPTHDANGNAYTYYVTEVDADGNDWTPVNFEKEEAGMKVTNTYVSPTEGQTGTKEWAPPDLLDEYKVTVWFQLWRYIGSDSAAAVKVGDPVAITAPWTYTWADMPTHDANGNAYTYFVTEVDADGNDWTPVNFEKEEAGMKVTNTYVSPTEGQTGTKEWAPPDLLDEYKVTVWFQLWRYIGSDSAAAVKVGDPVAITAPWTYTWADMPTHDANGNAYTYYVTEVDADGNDWTPVNFEKEEAGMKVTNTYVSPTEGQTGTKEWAPPDLLDEYKVTVWFQLWRYIGSDSAAAVKVGDPVAITAPWTYTWADMPTHDANGNAYTYFVTEVDADGNDWTPVNFEKEEAGMKVTNTYVSPTEGQTGTKEWAPPDLLDEYKVTVWFQLWRYIGSDSAAAVKVGDPVAITAPWTYTWADMPTHDANGNAYTYFVTEVDADGNDWTPVNFEKEEAGMKVTNTYVSPTEGQTGTKEWAPPDLLDEYKVTVWFQLWRYIGSDSAAAVKVGDPVAITAPWTYTWADMPTHDANGNAYTYFVTEVDADGNDWTPVNFEKEEAGMKVTNTYVSPTEGQTGTKEWAPPDLLDEYKVTVWFQLWRYIGSDSAAAVKVGDPVAITAPWTYTWADMPTHDANGNAYTYFVTEVDADGNDWTPVNFEKEEAGMKVTNTYVSPTEGQTGTKEWAPPDLLDEYKVTVWFQLWRYIGSDSAAAVKVGDPVAITAPWTYTWADMPTHDANGNAYTYFVTEVDADGNDWTPVNFEKEEAGMKVTNTYVSPTEGQTGTKEWAPPDLLDEYKVTVWFQLWRYIGSDSAAAVKVGDPVAITAPWTYTWADMPTHDANGNAYTYYVTEVDADGNDWTPPNFEKEEAGMKVTNTYVSPTDDLTATKSWMPADLLDELKVTVWFQLWRYIGSDPAAAVAVGDPVAITAPWTYTWAGMPTHDANGNAYTYYVTEVDADGNDWTPVNFEKEEDGMTVTNTYVSPTEGQTGTKEWAPPDLLDELKVTVWFQLWRYIGSDPTAAVAVGDPVAITAPWTYTWAGMPTHDANGNAYSYFVTEVDADGNDWTPPNFEKEEDGMTVTNTYVSPTDDLTATKSWMPADLLDELKVTVWFQLWRYIGSDPAAAVAVGDPVAITAPWTYTWAGMPTHDANGNAYSYFVTEVDADGNDWTPPNFEKEEDGMTVTNTYVSPTDDLTATKSWMPADLLDELKVTVWFQLWRYIGSDPTAAVAVGDPVAINAPWTYTWAGMPTHDANGNAYSYFVTEVDADGNDWTPPNFEKEEDGMTVTNTYVSPTDDLTATKSWMPADLLDELKVTVWFQLWRYIGSDPTAAVAVGDPVAINAPWTYTWAGMPTHDANGNAYSYFVTEVDADGNDWTPPNFEKEEAGMKVTNTYVSPTEGQTGTKEWAPPDLLDEYKVTVWFQLWRYIGSDSAAAVKVGDPVAITAPWTYTWADMPTHDANGNAYTYFVTEVDADGNDWTPVNFEKEEAGMKVTNTYVSPTEGQTGTKEWAPPDLLDEYKVTVWFQLWRYIGSDSAAAVKVGDPVAITAPWTYTWADMPTHDANGNAYTYYVTEVDADGNDWTPPNFEKEEAGMKVTNTYVSPTDDLTATKSWMPADLLDELKVTVWFQLWRYIGSDPAAAVAVGDPVAITAPWTYTWAGMPTHDANGNAYTYYVTEVDADGNDWTPVNFEKEEDGMTVTNTYVSPTEGQTGTKEWAPPDLLDELKVTVWFQLWRYIGSDPTAAVAVGDPVAITAPWTYTWAGMPTHDANGNAYSYFVTEVDADGNDWTPPNFEKEEDGMTVTNTYVSPTDDLTATKSWMPADLLDELKVTVWFQLWRYIGSDPAAAVAVGDPVAITAPWTYTWAGMPTHDANGNAYSYFVTEVDADGNDWTPPNFEKEEDGMTVTNTYVSPTDDLTATKSWMPADLLDELKVTVWFQLWRYIGSDPTAAVAVGDPVAINAPWTYTWAGMPTHDANGNAYSYFVTEVDADGNDWTPPNFEKEEDGMTVTNTYVSPTDDLTATKSWMPADLLDELKVTVWFQLWRYIGSDPTAAVAVGDPVAINAPWTYTWAGMPTHDANGNAYSYFVTEVDADGNDWTPPNFEKEEAGMKVTNTYVSPTDDLTATKSWMPDGLLDSMKFDVEFQLYRYTTDPDAPKTVSDPVTLSAPDWTYTWNNMPTHDPNGYIYTYYVVELTVLPPGFEKTEDGMTVINEYKAIQNQVVAQKVWVGGPSPRPTVWFQLWRTWEDRGTTYREPVPGADITELPDGVTMIIWDNIDMDTITGIPYTFYVKEVDANGFDFVPENYAKLEDGLTVTNTYVPPLMIDPLYINKVWEGGQAPYPAIYIHLYRNIPGGSPEPVGAPFPLDGVADPGCVSSCEISPWRWVVRDLPLTDFNGNPYTYTVRETDASGNDYTPENYVKSIVDLTVTNTYHSPKINITMRKIWIGGPEPRPNIRIQLYRNGEPYGETVRLYYPNTTYTWKDLDKTDPDGVDYVYTVDELALPAGYTKQVSGLTITNTYGDVPYTGDANNALLYGVLAISSLVGFGATVAGKRRKKK